MSEEIVNVKCHICRSCSLYERGEEETVDLEVWRALV